MSSKNVFLYKDYFKTLNKQNIIYHNPNYQLFISPPFSNYQSILKNLYNIPSSTIYIKGSYTLEPRSGLVGQVLKTLRYSFAAGGWVNKIGLRNPGIDKAIQENYINLSKKERTKVITSIAILDIEEIPKFEKKLINDMNIEINVSCPNVEHKLISSGLSTLLNPHRAWCIIKLSPITTFQEIDEYYNQGFRQFHCSNTLPIANGGLSGPSLQPYTSRLVAYISKSYPDCQIIAGGGIQNIKDIDNYRQKNVIGYSISTILFNPWKTYLLFDSLNNFN